MFEGVKATRVHLLVQLADGREVSWEARDPYEVEVDYTPGVMHVDQFIEQLHALGGIEVAGATMHIKGGFPYMMRVEPDSGEIPPELADQAVNIIDTMRWPESVLLKLRPYLARIAGRSA